MRFAIVLAKLLCGLVTAGILTAFIYFSISPEQNEYFAGFSISNICIILLTAALMIWALVSMVGDISRYKIDSRTIKEALNGSRYAPTFDKKQNMDFTELLAKINEANQQNLTPNFQNLNEQLSLYTTKNTAATDQITAALSALTAKFSGTTTNNVTSATTNSADISASLAQINSEIADLRTQTLTAIEKLNTQISQVLQNSNHTPTSNSFSDAQNIYSHVTEEANYPESVIDYTPKPKPQIIASPVMDNEENPPLDNFMAPDEEGLDAPNNASQEESLSAIEPTARFPLENENAGTQNNIIEKSQTEFTPSVEIVDDTTDEIAPEIPIKTVQEAPEPEDNSIQDIPLEDFLPTEEEIEQADIPLTEILPVEDSQANSLGASNPFGAPVDLNKPFDIPTVEPKATDLGASDPFGAPVDLNEPFDVPTVEPAATDLDAINPFGAPVDLNAPFDVPTVEPEATDLGASDPFGAPVNLSEPFEVPTVEPEAADLGASNPFGAPIGLRSPFDERDNDDSSSDYDAADPFGSPSDFADPFTVPTDENLDTLSASDPFGSNNSNDSSLDIAAIEPAVNDKKNEPNLDHIFNDQLASELAGLEIMQDTPMDKKTDKSTDDIELEQFFASHR